MQEQVVAGAGAVDIGDGGKIEEKFPKKFVHNIAQF
jgi:hypothetical protein